MPVSAKVSQRVIFTLPSDREILMTRVFDAPARLVFEAWTQAAHLVHWFGRHGWTLPVCEVDFKVGGGWRFVMRGPKGQEMGMRGVYREIVPFERLVYTESFDDYAGESVNTLTFAERDGKTTLTTRVVYPAKENRDAMMGTSMEEGVNECFDRLAGHLETMDATAPQELMISRVFHAPREVVFRAWTDAEQFRQWWGPKGFTNPVCDVDARPGGALLVHMRAPNGVIYPMTAVFLDVAPPERIVFQNSALNEKGESMFEVLQTVIFGEEGAKTRVTVHATVLRAGPEAAQHLAGMEMGWSMTLERLGEYLAA